MIVVGDHGPLLGEYDGLLGHAFSLDEELIRIPLVIKPPAAAWIRQMVYAERSNSRTSTGAACSSRGSRAPIADRF